MPAIHFLLGRGDQRVEQVVGLDAESLAARNLDVGLGPVFLADLVAKLHGTSRREGDHLVREVRIVRGLLRVTEKPECLDHGVLRIGLTRVNDVVNRGDVAEVRMIRLAVLGRNPDLVIVGIAVELAVAEVQAQQTELPKMISNVFADVTDRSVRTHDDLGVFVGAGIFFRPRSFSCWVPHPCALFWRKGGRLRWSLHHPAALVLAFGLEIEDALLFQLLEGRIPEVQTQDLAFARKEIVLDVETIHGLQMTAQYGRRNQFCHLSHIIATALDSM